VTFKSPSQSCGFGAQPTSYSKGTKDSFSKVQQQGCEAYHSTPSSAKINTYWSYSFTPSHDLNIKNVTFALLFPNSDKMLLVCPFGLFSSEKQNVKYMIQDLISNIC
jgi:hypothetical protein